MTDPPMCDRLKGRNLAITGSTRGLGLVQAERALQCGARHVTITSRPESRGGNVEDRQKAVEYLSKKFSADRFSYVAHDVSLSCPVDKAGKMIDDKMCNGRVFDPDIREKLGLPRCLHGASLNAGIFGPGAESDRRMDNISNNDFQKVMDINCKGVFHGIRDFAKSTKACGVQDPSIVTIKSIYGSGGSLFGNSAYMASKHCVNGLTKQAAIEFARPERGFPKINVNSVSPGFSKTPLTRKGFWEEKEIRDVVADSHPTNTWVKGEDIAEAVTFLLNPPDSITGVDLPVDNGTLAETIPKWSEAKEIRKVTDSPCCGTRR